MRMPFDFEGDEVAVVMEAVAKLQQELLTQPRSEERDMQMFALGKFLVKMAPVITAGMLLEAAESHARLN